MQVRLISHLEIHLLHEAQAANAQQVIRRGVTRDQMSAFSLHSRPANTCTPSILVDALEPGATD